MVDNCIIEYLNGLNKIAIAVSGGSDSMALLYWLTHHYDATKLLVINVEHGIRGDESVQDSSFVKDYCTSVGVECKQYFVDAPKYAKDNKMTLEQAARQLRHDIFADIAATVADTVALAHHQQDQAETIFMHIARGSGLNGLCGMRAIEGHLSRPFIHTPKDKIMQYIADNNIPFRQDSTNADDNYRRNFIRNRVFPTVKEVYPTFDNSFAKLSLAAQEMKDYIQTLLPPIEVINGVCILDIGCLAKPLAKEAIFCAAKLLGVNADIEDKHLQAIFTLASGNNGTSLDLTHNLKAYNENGLLALTTNASCDKSEYPFDIGCHSFIDGDYHILLSDGDGDKTTLFDIDTIPPDAVIRTARVGDKITLSYGTKSLGDYYTDKKIPRRLRGLIPVIASGHRIIAVADYAVAVQHAPHSTSTNYGNIQYITKDKIYE